MIFRTRYYAVNSIVSSIIVLLGVLPICQFFLIRRQFQISIAMIEYDGYTSFISQPGSYVLDHNFMASLLKIRPVASSTSNESSILEAIFA